MFSKAEKVSRVHELYGLGIMYLGSYVVLLVTASSRDEAERIAKHLVSSKLVACVNIVEGIKSFFWWEGKVDEAQEVLLIMKTRLDKLEKVIEEVKKVHSYQVPEVIALPIIGGYKDYLRWIDESLESR